MIRRFSFRGGKWITVNEYNEEVFDGYTVQMTLDDMKDERVPQQVWSITTNGLEWWPPLMADTEQPDKRPQCDWETNRGKPQAAPCGSEKDLFKVVRNNRAGQKVDHNICGEHLNKAWGKFKVEEAVKVPPSRTTG